MKLLVDACVAASAKIALSHASYEVESVAEWPRDPGDLAILAHAVDHQQSVVTLDKDFGELAIVRGVRHRGILRLVDIRAAEQERLGATSRALRQITKSAIPNRVTQSPNRPSPNSL